MVGSVVSEGHDSNLKLSFKIQSSVVIQTPCNHTGKCQVLPQLDKIRSSLVKHRSDFGS